MSDYPVARGARPGDPHLRLRLAALTAVIVGVVLVALAAFLFSYTGIHQIALQAGVAPGLARLYPLMFDAMLIVTCSAVLATRTAGWGTKIYVWLCLLLVVGAVAVGDALHATGVQLTGQAARATIAVVPWVLLLLGFGVWLVMLRHWRRIRVTAAVNGAEADRATQADRNGHNGRALPAPAPQADRAPQPDRTPQPDRSPQPDRAAQAMAASAAAGGAVSWAAGRGATAARSRAPRVGIDTLLEQQAARAPERPRAADGTAASQATATGQGKQRTTTPGERQPAGTMAATTAGTAAAAAAGTAAGIAAGAAAGSKPGTRGDTKPGTAEETRLGTTPETRPGTTAETRPGTTAETRPGTTAETRPGTTAEATPGAAAGAKPGAGLTMTTTAAGAALGTAATTAGTMAAAPETAADAPEAAATPATAATAPGTAATAPGITAGTTPGSAETTSGAAAGAGADVRTGATGPADPVSTGQVSTGQDSPGKDKAGTQNRRRRLGGLLEMPVSEDDEEGSVRILPEPPKAAATDAASGEDSGEAGGPGGGEETPASALIEGTGSLPATAADPDPANPPAPLPHFDRPRSTPTPPRETGADGE